MGKGKKVSAVIFLILAIGALIFGVVFASPIIDGKDNQTTEQAITTIVLILPALLSFVAFYVFDFVEFCLSISLIRNDSKGLGIINLILSVITAVVAIYYTFQMLA